jgi:hypothetical protein
MAGLIHLELLTDFFNKIGQKATSRYVLKLTRKGQPTQRRTCELQARAARTGLGGVRT